MNDETMYINRFCYRISKEANIGWDEGLQEACEAYTEVKINTKKEIPIQEKTDMHITLKEHIAKQFGINVDHLTPITEEEHDLNAEED